MRLAGLQCQCGIVWVWSCVEDVLLLTPVTCFPARFESISIWRFCSSCTFCILVPLPVDLNISTAFKLPLKKKCDFNYNRVFWRKGIITPLKLSWSGFIIWCSAIRVRRGFWQLSSTLSSGKLTFHISPLLCSFVECYGWMITSLT
jgi:hypothetical protein